VTDTDATLEQARADYAQLCERGLKLDLTRGKPSSAQLDLSNDLLALPGDRFLAADGTDTRNYGGLTGLPELRTIFTSALQVPLDNLLALNNSSLNVMHDVLINALLSPVPGAERRWVDEPEVAILCPTPGYDRHFALAAQLGFKLITVGMTADGPDMDEVERLVASDPSIKGIWCVPKYSNPDGCVYSDLTVQRLAAMPTAAPDFRILWDNAYAVHHLVDNPPELGDLFAACASFGNADRVFVFGSTSKITLAGAGVSFLGASTANLTWILARFAKATIGPNKVEQLRHAIFLRDADTLAAHMSKHAELIKPKFDAVDRILTERLGGTGLATWTTPVGGYFSLLTVPEGTATGIVKAAAEAGIALTPAGSTHPYGIDPTDSMIRIAPTVPDLADVETVIDGLAICVRLVALERSAG
jgi:DNA-binding transcriptional MocR family regulator